MADWLKHIINLIKFFQEKTKKNYKYVKSAFLREDYPKQNAITIEGKDFRKDKPRALKKDEFIYFKQNHGDKLRFERFKS